MNEKTKRIIEIGTKVVSWILVAFTVCIMIFTVISVTTVNRNERSIFGMKFYIVQSDSMSKSDKNADMDVHFNAGDIVIIKNVKKFSDLKEGDIISFMSTNADSFGETITHMIREVKREGDGKLQGYVTFGTNTGVNDEELVEPEYVLGKYSAKISGAGNFFAFMKSTKGYILCILIPFLLLIIYNGYNVIVAFRAYKGEQTRAMDEEKAAIREERRQNEELLKELMALKAAMLGNGDGGGAPAVNTEPSADANATVENQAVAAGDAPQDRKSVV